MSLSLIFVILYVTAVSIGVLFVGYIVFNYDVTLKIKEPHCNLCGRGDKR